MLQRGSLLARQKRECRKEKRERREQKKQKLQNPHKSRGRSRLPEVEGNFQRSPFPSLHLFLSTAPFLRSTDPLFSLPYPSLSSTQQPHQFEIQLRSNCVDPHPSLFPNKLPSVASGRRFPSDTGAFADWVASSPTAAGSHHHHHHHHHHHQRRDELCLGFNGGASNLGVATNPTPSSSARPLHHPLPNYPLTDVNVVGLRDVLVVAPPSTSSSTSSSFPFHNYHHQQQHHLHLGVPEQQPVIPLLVDDNTRNLQTIWQQQQNPSPAPPSTLRKPMLDPTAAACTVDFGASGCGGAVVASALSSSTTCQDCGNQAKKDCIHRRCRTCCKGRGLDCPTHVKSTWVPAARRRERQQQLSTAFAAAGSTSASTSDSKRPRLLVGSPSNTTTSTSNTTPPPTSLDTSSCHQDAGFRESLPKNVKAPAVFKCVRVTSIDDGDDSFAYHAMVKIGGHIFKGFLYDQGADQVIDVDGSNTIDPTTHSSSRTKHNVDGNSGATPNLSGLHLGSGSADLIGAAAATGGGGGGGGGHSDVYVAGDTEFANPLSC